MQEVKIISMQEIQISMQEDSYQYGGTHLISMEEDPYQYGESRKLVFRNTLNQYAGSPGEVENEAYLC